MSEGRERRVERAQRDLQIAEALHSRGGGTVGKFEAKLHPRDRTGKWRETFSSPERPSMGPLGRGPRVQQDFARGFGGPQSTAMEPPGSGPPPGALYAVRVGDHVRYYMNEQDVAEDAETINAYVETDTPFTITDLRTGKQGVSRFPPRTATPPTGASVNDLKAHAMANGGSASNAIDFAGYYREHGLSVSPEAAWVAFKNDPREFPNGFTTHVGDGTATRATVRRDERPNALSPEEHQFARGFGDIPTDVAGLRAFRARVAERIAASPDDGGPRFRAQTRKLQARTVKKIDAAIRSGRGLIVPEAAPVRAPDLRPNPAAARLAAIKVATGLELSSDEAQWLVPDAEWFSQQTDREAVLRNLLRNVRDVPPRSPDDGGPEFRRRARAERNAVIAKIDAALGGGSAAGDLVRADAAFADARERRVQAELSGDRGQRTGARVGGREGRWLTIQGKKKHIPRGSDWTHEDGTTKFDSPAGGTDVYRTGSDGVRELVSQPGQRGTHADVRQIQHHSRGGAPAPAALSADEQRRQNDAFTEPGRSRRDPVMAARIDALKAMSPGEHRVIDGAYVKREADNTYTVHHGYGSERYRTRNDVPGPGRNQGLGDYFATTRDARMSQLADVLRSIDQASQGAANAPNIMMTPMVQAGQMQSRMEVGDKVAVRWTGSGSQSGGNAIVKRINRASAVVTIDGGPQNGQDITIPLHDPGRQNRWSVNNRIIPRGAEIDRHVSRQESTPIRGDRLLQRATRDTGNRVTNAPREASGRIAYLVDGKGPYTAMEALAALGLPASGATPAEYEAWRRSQGLREATFTADQRRKLAKRGAAMPHGGFPISNLAQLKDAIQALGRAKDRAAAQRHIIKRAHALGLVSALPTDWKVREADVNDTERATAHERRIALAMEELAHESLDRSPKKNWVERAGQLPAAIQHMAKDIHEERGLPLEQAIPIAISQAKKLAAKGNAKYVAAVAEWEKLKATNRAKHAA